MAVNSLSSVAGVDTTGNAAKVLLVHIDYEADNGRSTDAVVEPVIHSVGTFSFQP